MLFRSNRRDDEIDDGSSSGEVDEGHRAVAVDDIVGEEALAGQRWGGNGGGAKDEGNVGAAPWRWRTGWLNRRDDEIDDGSSSGTVDEGRRGVAVDDVLGEEALAGWRMEQGVGFRHGFCRPRCTNGWADGMAVGNHGLETRLSEMWEIGRASCRERV